MDEEIRPSSPRRLIAGCFLLMFAAAFVLCTRISWSDGDDAFFLEQTASRSFSQFVSWRYTTWSGRIFAESAIFLTCRLGLLYWRIVNALMLSAFPFLLLRLAQGPSDFRGDGERREMLLSLLTAAGGYLLLSVSLVGYACIWITGSLNYLHGAVFATAALIPLRDALAGGAARTPLEKTADAGQKKGALPVMICGIVCAALGAGFAEQIGAILFVLCALGTLNCMRNRLPYRQVALAQTLTSLAVLLVSLFAPGNALRNAESEPLFFPGFSALPVSARLFLIIQYIASSFSNENSLLFCLTAFALFLCLLAQKKRSRVFPAFGAGIAVIAAIAATGENYCSDMGLTLEGMEASKAEAPSWGTMLPAERFTMLLWCLLLIAFLICLLTAFPKEVMPPLLFLASVASAAVMGFSPTVYASGARALFPSAWMFWLLLLLLGRRLPEGRTRVMFTAVLYGMGILHLILVLPGTLARL